MTCSPNFSSVFFFNLGWLRLAQWLYMRRENPQRRQKRRQSHYIAQIQTQLLCALGKLHILYLYAYTLHICLYPDYIHPLNFSYTNCIYVIHNAYLYTAYEPLYPSHMLHVCRLEQTMRSKPKMIWFHYQHYQRYLYLQHTTQSICNHLIISNFLGLGPVYHVNSCFLANISVLLAINFYNMVYKSKIFLLKIPSFLVQIRSKSGFSPSKGQHPRGARGGLQQLHSAWG